MASKRLLTLTTPLLLMVLGFALFGINAKPSLAQEQNGWAWSVDKSLLNNTTVNFTVTPGQVLEVGYRVTINASAIGNPTRSPDDIDDCARVDDDYRGFLGSFCLSQGTPLPVVFRYTLQFTFTDAECGTHQIDNTAWVTGEDTGSTSTDIQAIFVTVDCGNGGGGGGNNGGGNACAHGYGYWKNNAAAWGLNPGAGFFSTGQSYFDVLNTPPQGGNAYYQLAHDYIVAQLNQAAGASLTPDAQAAFNQAGTLLSSYTPAQINAEKGNSPLRQQFVQLAATLNRGSASLQCGD